MGSEYHIYTDGSADPAGRGGWAALIRGPAGETTLVGSSEDATNNRMELTAALEALRSLPPNCQAVIHTDSQYLRHAFSQNWLVNWQRNGWLTRERKPVKNRDLWEALLQECARRSVEWRWVRGHNGHRENELVDRLADCQRRGV